MMTTRDRADRILKREEVDPDCCNGGVHDQRR